MEERLAGVRTTASDSKVLDLSVELIFPAMLPTDNLPLMCDSA